MRLMKAGVVERGEGVDPLRGVLSSGVVFGEGEGDRIVGLVPMLDGAVEIPRPGADVGFGVVEVVVLVVFDLVRLGPHLADFGRDLHKPVLVGETVGRGIETAFAPDQRANQEGIDAFVAGDAGDDRVVGVFLRLLGLPVDVAGPGHRQNEEDGKESEDADDELAKHGLNSNLAAESARRDFKNSAYCPGLIVGAVDIVHVWPTLASHASMNSWPPKSHRTAAMPRKGP